MSCPSPVMNHFEINTLYWLTQLCFTSMKGLDLYTQRDHFLISKQAQYYSALAPNLIQIYKVIPLAIHLSYLPQIAYNKPGTDAGSSLYFSWQSLMYI